MDKESKPPTRFTMGLLGIYECDRMPFGLTNVLATFQQLMGTCLGDLNLNWCIIYLDDIVIFSKDLASHLKRLEAMFQKLEQARLKLKPSKCELFCRQIAYLGPIVPGQGIVTDKGKIDAIRKWPTPTTITKVQSFLGFTGYYCWFIPKFMQVAWPCMNWCPVKMQARRRWPSSGMTGVISHAMTWSICASWCLFLPMLILQSLSSLILILVHLT